MQFTRGTGELRQYQHTGFIITGRNEFFGNQIHSVMQTGHHTDISGAIKSRQLIHIKMLDPQQNGRGDSIGILMIDIGCQLAHTYLKRFIFIQR